MGGQVNSVFVPESQVGVSVFTTYVYTSSVRYDVREFVEAKFQDRIATGVDPRHGWCYTENAVTSDTYIRNRHLCDTANRRNLGWRIEVKFYEPDGAHWEM